MSGLRVKNILLNPQLKSLFPLQQSQRCLQRANYRSFFASSLRYFAEENKSLSTFQNIDSAERELASLLVADQDNFYQMNEPEGDPFKLRKEMIESAGLEFVEGTDQDGRVAIVGTKDGRTFSIKWDPSANFENPNAMDDGDEAEDEEEPEENEEEENENEEEENENEEGDENPEDYDDEEYPGDENSSIVEVKVTKANGDTLFVSCGIQEEMFVIHSIAPDEADTSVVLIEDLSDQLKEKIYDYLGELNVGSDIAAFIQLYNRNYWATRQRESYQKLAKFFSKN